MYKPSLRYMKQGLFGMMMGLAAFAPAPLFAEDNGKSPLIVSSSIKPIHLLVRDIGGELVEAELLLQANQSAHHMTLRPSQIQRVADSTLIFAIDPLMESGLAKLMAQEPEKWVLFAQTLSDQLLRREDDEHHDAHDAHEEHEGHKGHDSHEDHHDHDKHDGHEDHHDHDSHDGHEDHHDHDKHESHDNHDGHDNHDEHEDHAHAGFYDYHLFFSPVMMKDMAVVIRDALIALRPQHTAILQANYADVAARLDEVSDKLQAQLAQTKPNHFIAMHDMSLYLERDFDLEPIGFLLRHDHSKPSAKQLSMLQKEAKMHNVSCLFYEPQVSKRLVSQMASDLGVDIITLDPLGQGLNDDAGVQDYWEDISQTLQSCFTK